MTTPTERDDGENFAEVMEAYALEPTPATLRPLHEAILGAPNYDPLAALDPVLTGLEQAGDHQGIVDEIWRRMPGLFLSPSAHLRLSIAYEGLGEEAAARRERRLAGLALASIRDSGEGDEASPLRVLRVEDEYDVLSAVGRRSREQQERSDTHGVFDVHTTDDGGSWWFQLLWRTPQDT